MFTIVSFWDIAICLYFCAKFQNRSQGSWSSFCCFLLIKVFLSLTWWRCCRPHSTQSLTSCSLCITASFRVDFWPNLFNSPMPWRVLIPSFPFFCKFCQLALLPFHFILFPFFLYWTSKPIQTRLGTLFLSGILSPNLASFSPKPFGHVQLDIARSLAQLLHNLCRHELLISLYFTISVTIQPT